MVRVKASVELEHIGASMEDFLTVQGKELYVVDHPGEFSEKQVAIARATVVAMHKEFERMHEAGELPPA